MISYSCFESNRISFAANRISGQVSFFSRFLFLLALGAAVAASAGCGDPVSRKEKDARHHLQHALRHGSYAQAEQLALSILQYNPKNNGAWDRLVRAQCQQRHFEAAKKTLDAWAQAVSDAPPKLDEYRGVVARAMGDVTGTLQAWHKVLGAQPRNLRVLTKVARLEQEQEHWVEAEAAWTALLKVTESANALVQRALCRRHLHHWSEALADLHRAEELAPNDPEVAHGRTLFERLSKFLTEIGELDREIAVSPKDSALLADRSLLFLRSYDFELALEDAETATQLAPWAMRPRLFAAIALRQLGREADAAKLSVRKTLRLDNLRPEFLETIGRLDSEISAERTNAELYSSRAWQFNEIGQPELALQDATTAGQLDPKSAAAAVEKSYALIKLGKSEEAFAEITKATALDSNSATAWQYRGELEMQRDNFPAAAESFSRALSLDKTALALAKREECYRKLGWTSKADEDARALQEMAAEEMP
jgi:tetratricopeptide (TPR) repeat protein